MHLYGIGSFKKLLSFARCLIVRKSMHSRFNDVTSDTIWSAPCIIYAHFLQK